MQQKRSSANKISLPWATVVVGSSGRFPAQLTVSTSSGVSNQRVAIEARMEEQQLQQAPQELEEHATMQDVKSHDPGFLRFQVCQHAQEWQQMEQIPQPDAAQVANCKWWSGIWLEGNQNNPWSYALLENTRRQEKYGDDFLQASLESSTTEGEAGQETQTLDLSEDEQRAACEQVEIKEALPRTPLLASNQPAGHASSSFWTSARKQAHRWPRCRKRRHFDQEAIESRNNYELSLVPAVSTG